jgi:uncharacterized membrane protein YfcA
MSLPEILGLALAAALGGATNAVAGGGTLITFPTLLFFGTPSLQANATSTLALVIGNAGGIYGYRHHFGPIRSWLWRFAPASLGGSLIGSIWLTHTSERSFAKLVPFLILFATILFVLQGFFRKVAALEGTGAVPSTRAARSAAVVFQFLVAVYGGYFGAGIGILMLASLGFCGLSHIHEMNALKTILGALINIVAALWFIRAGLIEWPKAGVMTAGAFAGYFLGAHYAQRIPQAGVRRLITWIGFVLAGVTFYQQFFR